MKKILFFGLFLLLVACAKNKSEDVLDVSNSVVGEAPFAEPEPTVTPPEPSPEPEPPRFLNPFTGLETTEELYRKRPFALVINNLKKALPQSGLSEADIFYEVLAEGGITRLICVGQNFTGEKIGPIRSARDYFIDFALDNNAVFVHHGGSPGAYSFINQNDIDDIDGMALDGITFFRDTERVLRRGLEHSSYVIPQKILEAMDSYGIEHNLDEEYTPMFNFFKEESVLEYEDAKSAGEIILPFSGYQESSFKYNADKKTYDRFQNGEAHIDDVTGEQLNVTNVIVQFTDMKVIDNEGRMEVGLVGSGTGYLFSGGMYVPITWEKDSHFEQTKWYDAGGEILSVNRGKTWINVFDVDLEIFIND